MNSLSPDQWQRVRQVFDEAVKLPVDERQRFVRNTCPDESLAGHVASLLDAHLRAEKFLETPAIASIDEIGPDDLAGTHLGPYELVSRIGAGGMGVVYRARDSRLDRTVAIKVLPAHAAGDESARQRFDREARAVAALNHPHICTLYDVGTAQLPTGTDVRFLVMEFLDGETLADRLADAPLTPVQALEYAGQIAAALRFAHGMGIVHRDLKPANVMLTAAGAKLLDFGLAKTSVAPPIPLGTAWLGRPGDVTATGPLFGTLSYMAPELLRGDPADARTDVFAFGCVLYEMLTAARLFSSRTPETVLVETEEPPIDLAGSIPEDLRTVITRCVTSQPADRWQTAGDLQRELQRVVTARGELETRGRNSGRWRRYGVAASLAVALASAGGWVVFNRRPAASASSPAQLAVLPLHPIGEIPEGDRHLNVAIADSIITRLAAVRRIELRPTTAVLRYAEARQDPMEAAKALAVNHLLTGTIQEKGSTYRLSFQLARSPDGAVTWARTYDVVRSGLRDVQDAVAEQVVDALRLQLGPEERDRLRGRYTERPEAYDSYLKGRASLLNYTESGMREAIAAFERALAIDPQFAPARAGLAMATAWFSIRFAYETDALKWGERAETEARAALATDPRLADARLAIAGAAGTLHGGFNWPVVLEEASAALAIDPTLELAHVVRMRAYFHFGLFDRMAAEGESARQLNPLGNVEVARLEVAASLFSGQYSRARDQAAALLARSDAPVIRNYLGLAQFYTGDVAGARRTLAGVVRGGRPDVRSQAALASVEAAAGDSQAARTRAEAIAHGAYMDHHVAYSLAAAWAQIGDAATAVKWLRHAADTGFPCFPAVERDPLLNPIRRDPQFTGLLTVLQQRFATDTARLGRTP